MCNGVNRTEGKLKPGDVQEGSPVAGAFEDKTATLEDETATLEDETATFEDKTATLEDETATLEDETATLEDETATVGVDEAEASDCACLACFLLAAALVCQPHEHGLGLSAECLKKDPCRHFLIEAIAAKTSLLDGFWPLPVNMRRPSARSINSSAYCPMPRKWCNRDISAGEKTSSLLTKFKGQARMHAHDDIPKT